MEATPELPMTPHLSADPFRKGKSLALGSVLHPSEPHDKAPVYFNRAELHPGEIRLCLGRRGSFLTADNRFFAKSVDFDASFPKHFIGA